MNDGRGAALDIFFQGCSIGCKGCHNPELQDKDGGFELDTDEIIEHLDKHKGFYESIVFLGGEPLNQREVVIDIINRVDLYKVLYTGYLYKDIPNEIRSVMNMIVDGPYIEELKTDGFPASENQRIYYL
jgi:anaerobic ribonucleoside-triphosphate reductase activating protein